MVAFFNKLKEKLKRANHSEITTDSKSIQSTGINILVIDRHVPFFDRDAGSYRMFNLLKIFSELGYNVTFIGDDFQHYEPYDTMLEQLGIHVKFFPNIKSIKHYLSHYKGHYHLVFISRPDIAHKYMKYIRKFFPYAKIVYDTVDLRFLRELRFAELKNDVRLLKKSNASKQLELHCAQASDVTFVVSENEKNILLKEDPSLKIQVVSVIYDITAPIKEFSQRRDLMFLGGFLHFPNTDGVEWFVKEIFPKIKEKLPELKFFIVGDHPPSEIQAFSSKDIIVTGYKADLSDCFNHCRVFVAPLRFGAGVKGKIYHSMSYGLPVVTTTIGTEGIGVIDGGNIIIADDPNTFSEKVILLYQNEDLWNMISKNSVEYIQQHNSYDKSKNHVKNIFELILQ